MQKPDADGFVTITWPSRNIPHGGIFHSHIVQPSSARQNFLKVLLDESKLTIAQRRNSTFRLRQEEKEQGQPESEYVQRVRPRTSRRRSLSCIRESGVYELEPYKPVKRGEDREKMKDRLANTMAYGDDPAQTVPPPPCITKPKPQLPTAKEQWNELLTQIRERAEWLAEMEHLGQADPHRAIVQDQIAERLRALDALGIDSQCSSARSSASGFSTLRSREEIPSAKSKGSANKSVHSKGSQEKPKDGSARSQLKESQKKPKDGSARSQLKESQEKPKDGSARGQLKESQEKPKDGSARSQSKESQEKPKDGSARSQLKESQEKPKDGSARSRSKESQEKPKDGSAKSRSKVPTGRSKKEESVAAYDQLTPLQYTPRRRV